MFVWLFSSFAASLLAELQVRASVFLSMVRVRCVRRRGYDPFSGVRFFFGFALELLLEQQNVADWKRQHKFLWQIEQLQTADSVGYCGQLI